jgi:3-phosphoshikimate 1-carboxyvinyltransferase
MKLIRPSAISGKIKAPPSKSLMIRASASALLARGDSRLTNPCLCDDALAGLGIAEELGARVERSEGEITITPGGGSSRGVLNCRESGLCMRLFTPIAALSGREMVMIGEGTLASRPMGFMEKALRDLGVDFRSTAGHAPLTIKGPLRSGKIGIDGSLSSQFLTGLLAALPLCPGDSEIRVDNLKSKPYVAMTIDVLSRFGAVVEAGAGYGHFRIPGNQAYRGTDYAVEGDWSGAAFLLVAAALRGEAMVGNLRDGSLQADRRVLDALAAAGARVSVAGNSVTVTRGNLEAFDFDATDSPDLFPPLAVLALGCAGKSVIRGAGRLRHKESDRASALIEELSGLGAPIIIDGDALKIAGPVRIRGGRVDSHGDHRLAMAGAIAGLASESGVEVAGTECVSKSYPRFFEDLMSLGGDVS